MMSRLGKEVTRRMEKEENRERGEWRKRRMEKEKEENGEGGGE